jgi:hypothetical protein
MSRNSKNARNLAKAREISSLHKNGGKGPARTGTSTKVKAWWKLGSYSTFASGGKKGKQTQSDI